MYLNKLIEAYIITHRMGKTDSQLKALYDDLLLFKVKLRYKDKDKLLVLKLVDIEITNSNLNLVFSDNIMTYGITNNIDQKLLNKMGKICKQMPYSIKKKVFRLIYRSDKRRDNLSMGTLEKCLMNNTLNDTYGQYMEDINDLDVTITIVSKNSHSVPSKAFFSGFEKLRKYNFDNKVKKYIGVLSVNIGNNVNFDFDTIAREIQLNQDESIKKFQEDRIPNNMAIGQLLAQPFSTNSDTEAVKDFGNYNKNIMDFDIDKFIKKNEIRVSHV